MTPREIHRKAMEIVNQSLVAKEEGDIAKYRELTVEALAMEKKAAQLLFSHTEAEPTRSILFRGAATLAFNCGEYKEAEKLIYAGLAGNPPKEFELELSKLKEQVTEAILLGTEKLTEESKENYILLNVLRERAINFKLTPKVERYGKHVVLAEDMVDFFSSLKSSFVNYTKINFRKKFSPESFKTDYNKLLNDIVSQCNMLFVDLGFRSFGASISSDVIVKSEQYSQDITNWRRELFEEFKQEVFNIDYASEESINSLLQKYDDDERQKIYGGIINTFKESSNYRVSITDKGFNNIEKTLVPVNKIIQKKLLPGVKKDNDNTPKILLETISYAKEGQKGIPKSSILLSKKLDSAKFTVETKDITYEAKTLVLNDVLEIRLSYEHGEFTISFSEFDINLSSNDPEEIIKEFNKEFIALYSNLFEDTKNLSDAQLELKNKLEMIVFSRNW